ncbi:MBL fold metallo-hydrolase [Candidatus Roizmanbacteria bacterium]|nr:MBL fold metallo-hydrolase [Candidatus Roizmanbacteria bacterium]
MKITFLGTGSIMPDPRKKGQAFRSYASLFIELKKETLLFDIGPGTLTKMQQMGHDTRLHPDYLFISHYHIDHCQDYIALLKSRLFDIKTGKIGKGKGISVYGPAHLREWSDDLFRKTERWRYMAGMLQVDKVLDMHEVATGRILEKKSWRVSCLPVRHYDGVAFRLDAEGKSFVYSGDMGYDENLSILGKNADLVAVECSFPDRRTLRGGLHLCPQDIAKLANLGRFKKVALTHMYPQCSGREQEMARYIEKNSPSTVIVTKDGRQIEL